MTNHLTYRAWKRAVLALFPVALVIACLGMGTLTAGAQSPLPRIVILNSYHQGDAWADNEIAGLLARLREAYPDILPAIENLDTKRFPDAGHQATAMEFLAAKYQGTKVNLVFALDNPALTLILQHRDQVFRGAPVVFAGINNFRPEMIAGQAGMTGVFEHEDISGTLHMALALRPDTKHVLAIHDYTASGLAMRAEMEALASSLDPPLDVLYPADAPYADLATQLKGLSPDSIVLILTYVTDGGGRAYTRAEGTRLIVSDSPEPVFAMHETRLGYGIVGGMLLEGHEHGRQAAEMALNILAGQDAAGIPVEGSHSRAVLDYNALARFQVPASRWPAGAVVVNQPATLWDQYGAVLLPSVLISLCLGALVILLSIAFVRLRRAEEQLAREARVNARLAALYPLVADPASTLPGIGNAIVESAKAITESAHAFISAAGSDTDEPALPHSLSAPTQMADGRAGRIVVEDASRRYTQADREALQRLADYHNLAVLSKLKEQALRQSEAKYRGLFENNILGVVRSSPDGRLLEANQAYARMYGYDSPSAMLAEVNDVARQLYARPEDRQAVLRALADKGYMDSREFPVRRRDGAEFWVSATVREVRDPAGVLLYFEGTSLDITERKKAEAVVTESEARYRAIFESSPIAIWEQDFSAVKAQLDALRAVAGDMRSYLDAHFEEVANLASLARIVDVNQAGLQLLGMSDKAELLHGFPSYFAAEAIQVFKEGMIALTAGQARFTHEVQARDAAGRPLTLVQNVSVAAGHEADLSRVLVSFVDITKLKQAENGLRESEEKYRALVENVNDMIFTIDPEGRFTYISPASIQISTYSPDDLTGHHFTEFVHPDDLAALLESFSHTARGEIAPFVYRIIDKNGAVRHFRSSSRRLIRDGALVGYTGVVTDVTELSRATEEIRRLNDTLEDRVRERTAQYEAANKELEAFSYSVSHDLRAPLRALYGFTRILSEDFAPQLPPEARHYLDMVQANTSRMDRLINDLLRFSRTARQPLLARPFSMERVVSQVWDELAPERDGRCVEFTLGDLPPCQGDPALIHQVVTNLLSNALKFTRHRPTAHIRVCFMPAARPPDGAPATRSHPGAFAVQDDGAGFDMRYKDKLFGVFQRLHRADEYEGTGVGLAIVQRIILRHGGWVWAEAEPDRGATFWFTLGEPMQAAGAAP